MMGQAFATTTEARILVVTSSDDAKWAAYLKDLAAYKPLEVNGEFVKGYDPETGLVSTGAVMQNYCMNRTPEVQQACEKMDEQYLRFVSRNGWTGFAVPQAELRQQAQKGIYFPFAGATPANAASPAAPVATATATPVASPAQDAATPLAIPPSTDLLKKLAERFERRLDSQQTAQERAETLRREAERELSDKLRILEGKLKEAPNQAVIKTLKDEIAATKNANSLAEDGRKQALTSAVQQATAARDEVKKSFFYRHGAWVWALLGTLLLAVIGAYGYTHKQGRVLRTQVSTQVAAAAEPIKGMVGVAQGAARAAETAAQGATNAITTFRGELDVVKQTIGELQARASRQQAQIVSDKAAIGARLSGLQAAVEEVAADAQLAQEAAGVWRMGEELRKEIFTAVYGLKVGVRHGICIDLPDGEKVIEVTRRDDESVTINGIANIKPNDQVKIKHLPRVIKRSVYEKTLIGYPKLPVLQQVA